MEPWRNRGSWKRERHTHENGIFCVPRSFEKETKPAGLFVVVILLFLFDWKCCSTVYYWDEQLTYVTWSFPAVLWICMASTHSHRWARSTAVSNWTFYSVLAVAFIFAFENRVVNLCKVHCSWLNFSTPPLQVLWLIVKCHLEKEILGLPLLLFIMVTRKQIKTR